MAEDILAQANSSAPPLDTVVVKISPIIERDLAARKVSPRLRGESADIQIGAASWHYLTADQALAMLADASNRLAQVNKGLKNAYGAYISCLRAAIAEANERPSIFNAQAAVCTYKSNSLERWRGTKQQLQEHGIQLEGLWPSEPGGPERWKQARDARGYKASISRYSSIWSGIYNVRIDVPYEMWHAQETQEQKLKAAAHARRDLTSMPSSADEFRAKVVSEIRGNVRFYIDWYSKQREFHGYRFADGLLARIDDALDGVLEIVAEAQVHFNSAIHAEAKGRHRAKLAAADSAFQTAIAGLLKPNPEMLSGDEP